MTSTTGTETYKKDFWTGERPKFAVPHYRLRKAARLVNRLAGDRPGTVLDVGCGPGTLGRLLRPTLTYYGLDLSVPEPTPNLREIDLTEGRIEFDDRRFDVVVAQGVFEYLGRHTGEKLAEIARIVAPGGRFVATYVNFDHRKPYIYTPYSNVQPHDVFRAQVAECFTVERVFPTAYNWNHGEPNRRWLQAVNMGFNLNIPLIGRRLAVEYFFVCSARR
ncbi:MAG: class I SAM-dependent methyltransferase [Acidimicrobiaceae bacterium]|nr:class I SAM-dependent methyltransferase [Acidimicrobiaceae bacterium]